MLYLAFVLLYIVCCVAFLYILQFCSAKHEQQKQELKIGGKSKAHRRNFHSHGTSGGFCGKLRISKTVNKAKTAPCGRKAQSLQLFIQPVTVIFMKQVKHTIK